MLLESLLPTLPSLMNAIIFIVAGLGAVLLTYSVFIEKEDRSDLVRAIGALALFVYAISINNVIFMIALGGTALASLVEFVEIYLGLHHHSPRDLAEFKKYAFSPKKKS